jgi:hypothetical protein
MDDEASSSGSQWGDTIAVRKRPEVIHVHPWLDKWPDESFHCRHHAAASKALQSSSIAIHLTQDLMEASDAFENQGSSSKTLASWQEEVRKIVQTINDPEIDFKYLESIDGTGSTTASDLRVIGDGGLLRGSTVPEPGSSVARSGESSARLLNAQTNP